jgi:hypothetical protein
VADCNFKFYENDSDDNTLEILKDWKLAKKTDLFWEKLDAPSFGSVESTVRTSLLAYYRNKLKRLAGEPNTDYTLVVDSDLFFEPEHLEILIKSIGNAAMVTPNTQQNVPDYMFGIKESSYYDVYCLRDRFGSNGAYFSSCPFYNADDYFKWTEREPVKTFSSFAGFALIKSEIYNKVWWSSDFHSEHVNFCAEVNNYGDIYAIPTCKPRVHIDLEKYNLDNMKQIAQNQLQNFNAAKVLHEYSRKDKYKFGEILNAN